MYIVDSCLCLSSVCYRWLDNLFTFACGFSRIYIKYFVLILENVEILIPHPGFAVLKLGDEIVSLYFPFVFFG